MEFIRLTEKNIDTEHICCAFSDKKCSESYGMKKEWLRREFGKGYVFYRLNERAKVFIEYGPSEDAWLPVTAENYLNINCFWVSGKYKKQGLGKSLLLQAEQDAAAQGRAGLITVTGKKKFHFMSDGKWFLKQGFQIAHETASGFVLLVKYLGEERNPVSFNPEALSGECPEKEGLVAYYSNRCPYSEFHVQNSLRESAARRGLPLKVIKFETREEAVRSPSPATLFSLFYKGRFLTTDLSLCLDSRFDTLMGRLL